MLVRGTGRGKVSGQHMRQQPVELGIDDRVVTRFGGQPGEVHVQRLPSWSPQVRG